MSISSQAPNNAANRFYYLLVGTYTSGKSKGIYVYNFDSQTGDLFYVSTAEDIKNPSFLTVSPDNSFVYSVMEVSVEGSGTVRAYKFDTKRGALTHINDQPSGGADPCYISVDQSGKYLFVGNYGGGNLSTIPINNDGSLGKPVQSIQQEGKSINPERQEKSHVHSTVVSPDNTQIFIGDLGDDKIYIYDFQPTNREKPLKVADQPFISVKPGSGPRHLVFGEGGRFIYLVQELSADVSVFEKKEGRYTHLQTISLIRKGFEGEVSAAEIKISADGQFLYASNRGDANEIVVFKIDGKYGTLNLIGHQSSGGKTPRNFVIDPSGNFLLVAHQDSDSIVVFKRDKTSGLITPTDTEIKVSEPVFLKMVPSK